MNRFSIVLSCYNYERYLDQCLASLAGQDFPRERFEIICVDDGSTDGTPGLLSRYAQAHANVRVIRTENSGLEKACNTGIRAARYEWIVRVDADDALDPMLLRRLDRAMTDRDADFYYCAEYTEHFSDAQWSTKRVPAFDREEIFERGDFFATGTAYRRTDLESVGLFPDAVKNCGLENYAVILALLAKGKTGYAVPEASFLYRRHSTSMSTLKRTELIGYGKRLLAAYGRPYLTNENHPYGLKLITAIVQARTASTRLPNKIFARLGDRLFIERVIERIRECALVSDIVVATTDSPSDDTLAEWLHQHHIRTYRGSVSDVLDRFYRAAAHFHARHILRVTADDPFKDTGVTNAVIDLYLGRSLDFATNNRPPSFPEGLDVEVFSFKALELAAQQAKEPFEREHVTPYLAAHPEHFKQQNLSHPKDLSSLRWTVDTPADLEMAAQVYARMKERSFGMSELLALFEQEPQLAKLNANQKRSALYTS